MELQSETIGAIAVALAKAQGEMQNAAMNSVNPHFKSKYADIAAIRDAIIPALSKNDIALVQVIDVDANGNSYVITKLIHKSGEWLQSKIEVVPDKNGSQAFGSALTYARRYAMSAIAAIASEEDDDGNASSPELEQRGTGRVRHNEGQRTLKWQEDFKKIKSELLDPQADLSEVWDHYRKELRDIEDFSPRSFRELEQLAEGEA